jgi:hypothetical protein
VFRGGVLDTRSAWVIGFLSLWLGLEPGRKCHLPLGFLLCYAQNMKKAISVMQKRGRPATGKMPTIALRATDEFRDTVERWAAKQSDKPNLSEAIRRLVELGLKVKGKQ